MKVDRSDNTEEEAEEDEKEDEDEDGSEEDGKDDEGRMGARSITRFFLTRYSNSSKVVFIGIDKETISDIISSGIPPCIQPIFIKS